MDFLDRVVEERIRQAQAEGRFDRIPGRGQPLRLADDPAVPDRRTALPRPSAALLVFDLDGTLADTKQDLSGSVNHVRHEFGLPALDDDAIARMIGDGARALVERALGELASGKIIDQGLELFLAYYREHMLDRTTLYPGVEDTLDVLDRCTLAVLTNKPYRFSRHLLEGLGILDRFVVVYGGNSFDRKKPDPVGLHRIIEDTGMPASSAWMIGDSAVDVRTGRAAGVRTCGVSYGYGAGGFGNHPPDVLIDRFAELSAVVSGR
jgi:phosphoglycolate phosphatase